MGEAVRAKHSTILLFGAAVSMITGGLLVSIIGQWEFDYLGLPTNFRGEPMESGQRFHPQSVSDMAHDPTSPQGKCFFAFWLIAGVCLLMSAYPYSLCNAYTGDDAAIFGLSWLTMRSVLPPAGLILTVASTMTPVEQINGSFSDMVSTGVHAVGAQMLFVGSIIFEVQCLFFSTVARIGATEKIVRATLLACCLICCGIWVVSGALSFNKSFCCQDVWVTPTLADVQLAQQSHRPYTAVETAKAFELNMPMLLNSANGTVLTLKQTAYWFENLSGFFVGLGLLAIWWFAPERHINLSEDVPILLK